MSHIEAFDTSDKVQKIGAYRRIKDFLYVTSHSGLPGVLVLGFLVAAGRFIVAPPAQEIIENITKGYAGVVERIIESDISCKSVPMTSEGDKCFMRHETTTHPDGTVAERQIPYFTHKSTGEDIYPLGYSERLNMTYDYAPSNIIHYNSGQRPGGQIIPTNDSSIYDIIYPSVNLGEMPIWYNKQISVTSTYSQSFTLGNQSNTRASFKKSENFQLHSSDVPKDAEIAKIARELSSLLQKNENKGSIIISPRASIEGKSPEAILGKDPESDILNRRLADQRGKYIYDRLIVYEPSLKEHLKLVQGILSQISDDDLISLYVLAENLGFTGDVNSVHKLIGMIGSGKLALEDKDSKLIQRLFDRNTTIQYTNSSPRNTKKQSILGRDDGVINVFRIAMLLTMLGIIYTTILTARNAGISRLSDKVDTLERIGASLSNEEKVKLDAWNRLLDRVSKAASDAVDRVLKTN